MEGGIRSRSTSVIATTNALYHEVTQGVPRGPVLPLECISVTVPARERPGDIPLLARHFPFPAQRNGLYRADSCPSAPSQIRQRAWKGTCGSWKMSWNAPF